MISNYVDLQPLVAYTVIGDTVSATSTAYVYVLGLDDVSGTG